MYAYPVDSATQMPDSNYPQSSHNNFPCDSGNLWSDKESCTWLLSSPCADLDNSLFQDHLQYKMTVAKISWGLEVTVWCGYNFCWGGMPSSLLAQFLWRKYLNNFSERCFSEFSLAAQWRRVPCVHVPPDSLGCSELALENHQTRQPSFAGLLPGRARFKWCLINRRLICLVI